eukprot:CAMPEP_0119303400 /NCGR_PEP_ID=MMETSP1333-20130426/4836_1 /TAXON_ID=418940 /ORGANISM="Scyphosphaera apsteinii, Strain RCC1455" /LENGTH=73 /DNA_ID=CAMNT_0007306055 /DNA_START=225 /DNA_END=442 /DNA_ORIENTATION=-
MFEQMLIVLVMSATAHAGCSAGDIVVSRTPWQFDLGSCEYVDLSSQGLGDAGSVALAEVLQGSGVLNSLFLDG